MRNECGAAMQRRGRPAARPRSMTGAWAQAACALARSAGRAAASGLRRRAAPPRSGSGRCRSRCAWLPPKRCATLRIGRSSCTARRSGPGRRPGSRAWRRWPTSRVKSRVVAVVRECRGCARRAARCASLAAGADEGHHRVQVVEGVVARAAIGAQRSASASQRSPTSTPRSCSRHSSARCVDHVQHDRRARRRRSGASNSAAPRRCRLLQVEQRQVPPVVHGEEAALDQASVSARSQAMPSRRRFCISMHVRDRMPGPAVARARSSTPGGRCSRPARSRRTPPARRHACRAPRGSRASRAPGRQGAGDAVAQHARVAGEEVDLVAGLQRQRVQRVGGVTSSSTRAASRQRPSTSSDRAHVRPLAIVGWQRLRRGSAARATGGRRLGAEQVQPGVQPWAIGMAGLAAIARSRWPAGRRQGSAARARPARSGRSRRRWRR